MSHKWTCFKSLTLLKVEQLLSFCLAWLAGDGPSFSVGSQEQKESWRNSFSDSQHFFHFVGKFLSDVLKIAAKAQIQEFN